MTTPNASATNTSVDSKLAEVQETKVTDLHIIMVLDASGSMDSIRDEMIKAINQFIKEQQKLPLDDTTFSLLKFNTVVTSVYLKRKLAEVKELTREDYIAEGGTALYDAIGKVFADHHADKNVCMVIVTDGEENSSKEYKHSDVSALIEYKKTMGWKFIYLSSDLSAAKQGTHIGFVSSAAGVANTSSNNRYVPARELSRNVAVECCAAVSNIRVKGAMYGMGSGDTK